MAKPHREALDWLKADVLKMHRLAGQRDKVKQRVAAFLEQYTEGSDALFWRVGLAGDGKLARVIQAV